MYNIFPGCDKFSLVSQRRYPTLLRKYFVRTATACTAACILIFVVTTLSQFEEQTHTDTIIENTKSKRPVVNVNRAYEDVRYILQWTASDMNPFPIMGKRNLAFLDNNCVHTNCFVTDDRNYFNYVYDMTDFDAVVFNGRDMTPKDLPKLRSPRQKYIFAMTESGANYPECEDEWNSFFNWTWTYRLDSDIRLGYLTFYDELGVRLGPKVDMDWSTLKNKQAKITIEDFIRVKSKTRAAAWFVTNCNSQSKREDFVRQLKAELERYNLTVDVYGGCSKLKCPKSNAYCDKMLERHYFFYLSFENSFAEDYVTEKLLTALDHNTVPVVYGGANYSRFLPPGSYLNARELGPKGTAERMRDLLSRPEDYVAMLHQRAGLQYRLTWDSGDICALCALLNDRQRFEAHSTLNNFTDWWRTSAECANESKRADRDLQQNIVSKPAV